MVMQGTFITYFTFAYIISMIWGPSKATISAVFIQDYGLRNWVIYSNNRIDAERILNSFAEQFDYF